MAHHHETATHGSLLEEGIDVWDKANSYVIDSITHRSTLMSEVCIFCEIMAGRAPGDIVYHDDLTAAFIDPRQHNQGHVLVVPRAHINDIREFEPRAGAGLMDTLIKIARAVSQAFPNEGMSLWHSIGPAAFQEVPHMHMHVHPRRLGDGLLRVYPGVPVDEDLALRAAYAERLRKALA